MFVKLLISNAAAGSVIGRGGAMVTTLQKDTRTRMQLSRSGEYFPGTMDRVLLVAGRRRNIVTALEAILFKLMTENVAPLHPHTTVKVGPAALLNLRNPRPSRSHARWTGRGNPSTGQQRRRAVRVYVALDTF